MSIIRTIRDGMLNYAENAVKTAKEEYRKTKIKCTVINLIIFIVCGIVLLLKTFVF